jgi:hypothetical protein
MAMELAVEDPVYEDMAIRFLEHFLRIGSAMDRLGNNDDEMWDEEDGFFYDVLRLPDGSARRLKVRSMVGLLPLCATTVIRKDVALRMPRLVERAKWFLSRNKELSAHIAPPDKWSETGYLQLCLLDETKLRRVLARLLDEKEFFSPYGVRSLSKFHQDHPYIFNLGRDVFRVDYLPGESDTGMFGGNSNWRGPIWMPVNGLLVRALHKLHLYYGESFKVECPTGSGNLMNLEQVALELCRRLGDIFVRDAKGKRAAFGDADKFQNDPHWKDNVLFYEFFHGDTGAGLGASHQTGWTGVVAKLIHLYGMAEAGASGSPLITPVSAPAPKKSARVTEAKKRTKKT